MRKLTALVLGLLFCSPVDAITVKGLTLGEVANAQQLADVFGSANCPNQQAKELALIQRSHYSCSVPISYLGIKTSATIYFNRGGASTSISIELPADAVQRVEPILTEKYGAPSFKDNIYTRWEGVEGSDIRLRRALPMNRASVTYTLRAPSQLDSDDI